MKAETEELNRLIDLLEKTNSKDDAYMAIHQIRDESGECFMKSNKQGLELFAVQLLKASIEIESVVEGEKKNIIPLDFEEEWIEGNISIQYIEHFNIESIKTNVEDYNENVIDKLVPIGCFAGLIFIIISTIVGAFTIIMWLM